MYNQPMPIDFDPSKDEINRGKHGISLAEAGRLDWPSALIWRDTRVDYQEDRYGAYGLIGERVYCVAFALRGGVRRIISLRRANLREVRRYVSETT